jgi:tRNA pseudouridine55 synthase
VLQRFIGMQNQTPPMHSALKVAGKPLYAYARAGVMVERQSRAIVIKDIQLIDFKENIVNIRVLCSKGTYIRVLAEDIGSALACGAHLIALTRESAGGFKLVQAISCDTLESLSLAERMDQLLPIDAFASSLERIELEADQTRRIMTGQEVVQPAVPVGLYRLYDDQMAFFGVGEVESGVLKARRLTSQLQDREKLEKNLSNPAVTG